MAIDQSTRSDIELSEQYPVMVLLVDDQRMVGEAVRGALANQPNIDFHYCSDPSEALAVARQMKPTVILQDLIMPGVDGLDLVRQYRADKITKDIPVIVLSAKEDPATKGAAFIAGANDYLVKLPDKIELVARIRYHSKAYLNQLQRDDAYRSLRDSQRQLLDTNLKIGTANEGLAREIEIRQQAERRAAGAREEAERANRTKSEFLAAMSHEIRTPMNGIMGMNDLLSQTELTEKQRNYVRTIKDCADDLMALLNDILDISKLEAGKIDLEYAAFNLEEIIHRIVELLAPRTAAKGLKLEVTIATDVPTDLIGDSTRVRQILLNLIGNAIKFTDHGSITVGVSLLERSKEGVHLRLEVVDTGIGIDDSATDKLFEKFHQADVSITRRFGGSGLGLAISKQLVELMNGQIGVDSRAGAGSTFWFEILFQVGDSTTNVAFDGSTAKPSPTRMVKHKAGKVPGIAASSTSATRAVHSNVQNFESAKRILVVEDNRVNQAVAKGILENAGFIVDIAENGEAAVGAVEAGNYDLVLMDSQMPVLDGLEATRRIRRLIGPKANVPIVATTADAMSGSRERYLEAGMTDYISKPIDPRCLLNCIDGILTVGNRPRWHEIDDQQIAGEAPLLQEDVIAELEMSLTPDHLSGLIEEWIEESLHRVARLRDLAALGNLKEMAKEAHDLIGTSGNFGAIRLMDLCRDLELACKNNDEIAARESVAQITAASDPTWLAYRHRHPALRSAS
jgi:signal transduction histidine kinase/HPt (histidine-containing phosphotransfer) domain-containing protein